MLADFGEAQKTSRHHEDRNVYADASESGSSDALFAMAVNVSAHSRMNVACRNHSVSSSPQDGVRGIFTQAAVQGSRMGLLALARPYYEATATGTVIRMYAICMYVSI